MSETEPAVAPPPAEDKGYEQHGGKWNKDPHALPPPGEGSSGCCGPKVDPHAKHEPHKCPTTIERSCTDMLAFLMLIATWVITTGLGVSYLQNSNMQALIAPVDAQNRICGVDAGVKNYPFGYITAITEEQGVEWTCVKKCPTSQFNYTYDKSVFAQLICQEDRVADGYKYACKEKCEGAWYEEDDITCDCRNAKHPGCCGDDDDDATCDCNGYYSPSRKYIEFDQLVGKKSESWYDDDETRTSEITGSIKEFGTGPCMIPFESIQVGFYCVPDPDAAFPKISALDDDDNYYNTDLVGESIIDVLETAQMKNDLGILMGFFQDLVTCKDIIFGFGFAVALLVAFFYTKLLSMGLVTCIVWGCIIITFVFKACAGVFFYTEYTEWKNGNTAASQTHSTVEIEGMRALAYTFFALAALWVCFIICIRDKIALACAFVECAGNAIRDMPIMCLFPLIQVAGLVLFLVPWMYYSVAFYAQGSYSQKESGMQNGTFVNDEWSFEPGNDTENIFMMFSYFWTSQFIVAMGQLIMAMGFTLWYFAGYEAWAKGEAEKLDIQAGITVSKMETDMDSGETTHQEGKKKVGCLYKHICGDPDAYRGNGLFFKGIHLSLYHVGTAAAGSLIIAIIKTIEYIVAKIQEKCNKDLSGPAKTIANIVLCCIQCCLYCVEKCMKFINKHAYIITAVQGKSFCAAACSAFWLIARNIRLIAALTMVQEFCIIIGKLVIVAGTGALSLVYMNNDPNYAQVNSLVGPVLFVMILAYFIADMFMVVYSMAMDTMMHCYLSDKESNVPEAWAMQPEADHLSQLGKLIGKHKLKDDEKNPQAPPASK